MSEKQPTDLKSCHPSYSQEDLTRLLNQLCECLGATGDWSHILEQQLNSLLRGLRWLEQRQPTALPWRQAIQKILADKSACQQTASAPLSRLGVLLAAQPTLSSKSEIELCLGLGAVVTINEIMGIAAPIYVQDGLEQLYRSQRPTWSGLRRQLSLGPVDSTAINSELTPTTASRFLLAAVNLLDSTFPPPPAAPSPMLALPLLHPDTAKKTDTNKVNSETPGRQRNRQFETSQNLYLFEFQTVQQEQEPRLNRFRLENDWNSLTDSEFKECCQILTGQLHSPHNCAGGLAESVHAASRYVSMLAQLSLEQAASLPLGRQGSMHLDLKCGILRRDLQVVAPRTDRTKGHRWRRRWLRTPIPTEVLAILRKAADKRPQATTLGDLLVYAGLTPRACHQLVNRGRGEFRTFDSLRVARSLRAYLLRIGIHPSVVSRATGDITVVPRSQQYYLLLPQQQVHLAINSFCSFAGLQHVDPSHPNTVIGSPKACSFETMRAAFCALQQDCVRARSLVTSRSSVFDLVRFHNQYTSLVALQMLWSIGARCQNISSISVADIYSNYLAIIVADRNSDRYAQRRACPLTPAIQQTLRHYVEHLRATSSWLTRLGEESAAMSLARTFSGLHADAWAFPQLTVTTAKRVTTRPLRRADIKLLLTITKLSDLNVPRHFLISELVHRDFSAIGIDALVGQHQAGAEPFGFSSGLSVHEFLGYAASELQRLHDQLGITPLIGLGRTDRLRLKLPTVRLPEDIPAPENRYLDQRLAVDDFNPADTYHAEEDCPISRLSMAAKCELERLQRCYLNKDVVRSHHWHAVAFSLIVFDLVINPHELDAFLEGIIAAEDEVLGELTGIEVKNDQGAVIGQCLMGQLTKDALRIARAQPKKPSVHDIKAGLIGLIRAIDPDWPDLSADQTIRRLQSLAAHWSMVMMPPVARFSSFHKAPCIPIRDIRRIAFKHQPELVIPAASHRKSRLHQSDFRSQIDIVSRWANKDAKLGEYKERSKGLAYELSTWQASNGRDDADQNLHDFLADELGERPPFRRLSLPVLAEYLAVQVEFFELIRSQLGDFPKSPEEWKGVIEIFHDDQNEGKRRWAGLHVGAWLSARGLPVPPQLRQGSSAPFNYRPHSSIYVTSAELEQSIQAIALAHLPAPIADWKSIELRLRRRCAFRPQEARFLLAKHHTADMTRMVVTTSGHIHLKSQRYSRGMVTTPEGLQPELRQLAQRRLQSPSRLQSSMFVLPEDDGYPLYDSSERAALLALKSTTGRAEIRLYDLRACAISDLIIDIPGCVDQLVNGSVPVRTDLDGKAITKQHRRAAVGAREARQASVHTTLRYYYQGGELERRFQLNLLQHTLPQSATFTAAIQNTTVQAIHAKSYRAAHGATARRVPAVIDIVRIVDTRPDHPSTYPVGENSESAPTLQSRHRIMAMLLHMAGTPVESAADASRLPIPAIKFELKDMLTMLSEHGIARVPETTSQPHSAWLKKLEALSEWAYMHRSELQRMTTSTPKVMRPYRSKISFRNFNDLKSSAHLWQGLVTTGFIPVLFFSRNVSLSDRASAVNFDSINSMDKAPQRLMRQQFAAMKFRVANKDSIALSNHTLGKVGRLVVTAILLASWLAERNCNGDKKRN